MKQFIFILLCLVSKEYAIGQGVTKNGKIVSTEASYVNRYGANPTTADYKTTDGTSLSCTGNLTGLIAGTTYYVRAMPLIVKEPHTELLLVL